MDYLLYRCRRRAHLTEELVEEAWYRDHRDAMQAWAAQDVIRECLELGELLGYCWKTTVARLFDERIDDIDGLYPIMIETLELAIGTHQKAYKMGRRAVDGGFAVEGFSRFSEAILELERLKLEIEAKWPRVNPQMTADSMAAYRRGEYQSAEDILRESQGNCSPAN